MQKNVSLIAVATALILLVPLIAMQFTDAVIWGLADFIVAGILLFGFGLTYELISGKMESFTYRAAIALTLATSLLMIWMDLAVGIIGNAGNPANLLFFGVLVIGLIGAFIARLQSRAMAYTLFAMAFAQILIGIISLITGLGSTLIIGMFAFLWFGSALLFMNANEHPAALKY